MKLKRHRQPFDRTKKWFKSQSNAKLIITGLIIMGVGYVVFGFGYDDDYHQQVEKEKKLAVAICENSANWVFADPNRLKHGKSGLENVRVNGKLVKLEHVKYPKVLFLDSGIRNITLDGRGATTNDIFCFFKDPRSSSSGYYYNYETRQWVDKARFRR